MNCTLSSYIVNSINTHSVPDVNTCNPLFIPSTTLAKMGDIAIYNIPTGMFNSNLLKYFVPPPNIQPGEDEDEDENEKNNTGGKQITKRKRQENKKKRTLRQHKKNKTLCKGTRRRRRLKQKKTSSLSLRN